MLIRLTDHNALVADLAVIKQNVRAPDGTDDDARLQAITRAQTQRYEEFTGRIVMPGEFLFYCDRWLDPIKLPVIPVSDVTSVAYLDPDNQEQVLDDAVWYVAPVTTGTEVRFTGAAALPSLSLRANPVWVAFTAGAESAATVDPVDVTNILTMVQYLYDNDDQMTETEMRKRMGNRRVML